MKKPTTKNILMKCYELINKNKIIKDVSGGKGCLYSKEILTITNFPSEGPYLSDP